MRKYFPYIIIAGFAAWFYNEYKKNQKTTTAKLKR